MCCVCSCSVSGFPLAAVSTIQSIKPWLLLPRPGYLTGLGSLQLEVSSSGCSSCCLISSDLIDCQALPRPDFDHPPVLQQTALSYCLDSHFSPVNLSLVNKRHSLDYSASGSLSSKLVWQNHDRTNQPSPDPAEWVLKLFHLPLQKGDWCYNGQWHRFDSRAGIHGALLNSFGPWLRG